MVRSQWMDFLFGFGYRGDPPPGLLNTEHPCLPASKPARIVYTIKIDNTPVGSTLMYSTIPDRVVGGMGAKTKLRASSNYFPSRKTQGRRIYKETVHLFIHSFLSIFLISFLRYFFSRI